MRFKIYQSGFFGRDFISVSSILDVKKGVGRREWHTLSYTEMLVTFHKISQSRLENNFHSISCMLPEKITASNLTVTDTLLDPARPLQQDFHHCAVFP